jgi:phage tail tape-measure protein
MPKVKPAGSGVRVENVTLSPKAFAIAQLETEKETIDRMILKTSREIEAYKQRMRELYHRRDITQRSMHALINTRD